MTQIEILEYLERNPGRYTTIQLCQALGRNKTSVSRCLRCLARTKFANVEKQMINGRPMYTVEAWEDLEDGRRE